ncbi:TPA: hypothetical protein NV922_001278 [Escherichia coli]|nr:hypothetical protein [Escherichia coli]
MGVMLYKSGRGTKVWGKEYQTVVVRDDELSDYLSQGWKKHPDEVVAKTAEEKPAKRTRRTNAEAAEQAQAEVTDEPENKG